MGLVFGLEKIENQNEEATRISRPSGGASDCYNRDSIIVLNLLALSELQ